MTDAVQSKTKVRGDEYSYEEEWCMGSPASDTQPQRENLHLLERLGKGPTWMLNLSLISWRAHHGSVSL